MPTRRPIVLLFVFASLAVAQGRRGRDTANAAVTILKPARVFDGEAMHEGWMVLVRGDRIDAAGPSVDAADAKVIDLPGLTLMPGLVEGHSHMLLHAYNETSWNDQVAHESAGAARRAGDQSSARHAHGRLHHHARPGDRRRAVCRRRTEAGGESGNHSRAPDARRPRARSSPLGAIGPRASRSEWRVPQGAEEADGSTAYSAWCEIRSATGRTGSSCTPITAGVPRPAHTRLFRLKR